MKIVILEICEDGEGCFLQGRVQNRIQTIFVPDIGYKTDEAKRLLDDAFKVGVPDDFMLVPHLRQFTFTKKQAEELVKVLVRKDIEGLVEGEACTFAAEG